MTEQRSSHALENSLQTLPFGFFLRQHRGLLAIKLMLLVYFFCRGLSQPNTRWQRDISPGIWGKAHSLPARCRPLCCMWHYLFCSVALEKVSLTDHLQGRLQIMRRFRLPSFLLYYGFYSFWRENVFTAPQSSPDESMTELSQGWIISTPFPYYFTVDDDDTLFLKQCCRGGDNQTCTRTRKAALFQLFTSYEKSFPQADLTW